MPIPSQNKFILLIAEAIAHHEGFYAQGSNPAKRNNNPGNLRGWSSKNPKDSKGFDEFPTRRDGFNALYRQVEKNIVERELSLREFFGGKPGVYGGFAPDSDGNNSLRYAEFVCNFLEQRGFYPISIDNSLSAWWADYGEPTTTKPDNILVKVGMQEELTRAKDYIENALEQLDNI